VIGGTIHSFEGKRENILAEKMGIGKMVEWKMKNEML
jgi:hypothetical protein